MAIINPELEPVEIQGPLLNRELVEAFEFSLEGHQLKDPSTNRGRVTDIQSVASIPTDSGFVEVTEISVSDPFKVADPEGYKLVRNYIDGVESKFYQEGYSPIGRSRSEAGSEAEFNDFTRAWLANPEFAALAACRSWVPGAIALHYLTNPWVDSIIPNNWTGQSTVATPEAAALLRFTEDAIGIRIREVGMEMIATDHLMGLDREKSVRWASLATGTAEPSIASASDVANVTGAEINLTVVDNDPDALALVEQNAAKYDFSDHVTTVKMNILLRRLRHSLAYRTGSVELYDVVENTGFVEYLPQEGDEIGARKGEGLPQASEFTRRAFELVKPGGILISGNMVLNRPQRHWLFEVVDWPLINARSEESILRVYKEAGILDDPNARVEIFRIKDDIDGVHLYDMVKVTKLR